MHWSVGGEQNFTPGGFQTEGPETSDPIFQAYPCLVGTICTCIGFYLYDNNIRWYLSDESFKRRSQNRIFGFNIT